MGLTLAQAQELADRLFNELNSRYPEVDRASQYYRGEQPLCFASSEFKEYFGKRYEKFSDNWVQVVADAPVERLTVTGFKPYGEEKADAETWRVWQTNGLDVESQLAFLGSVTGARSYGLVWGNPDDDETPTVTFEDARQAIIAYRPGSRRDRLAALKAWQDGSHEYATLYLADEVWKLKRPLFRNLKSANMVGVEDVLREWLPRETGDEPNPQDNPMGVVPMVELPNRPLLAEEPISDVSGVIAMQDAINFIWALLFNAADFASFPQRVVLGAEAPKTPILDEQGKVVGTRPVPMEKFALDRVLWVTDENAKIASWPAANLTPFTEVLEVQVGHVAAQTRTPSHYLVGKMVNVTGDALLAAETGLAKKSEEKQLWTGGGLRELSALIARAQGNDAKARQLAAGTTLWKDVQSRSNAQLADALLKLKQMGFPFEYLASQYGLTPTEIVDLMKMREREIDLDPFSQAINGKPDVGLPEDVPPPPDGE